MINQEVVNKITRAIWLYNAECSYTEIAKYLEVEVDVAIKMMILLGNLYIKLI